MGKYKLIAVDVDGTLVKKDQTISPRTVSTLLLAQQQGVKVAICSGRPTYGIAPHADTLRLADHNGYVVSFNGGEIHDWATRQCLHAHTLDASILPYLYECSRQHGFHIMSYVGTEIIAEAPDDPYIQFTSMRNKMPVRPVPNFLEEATYPLPKCMIVGDPEPLHRLEEEMQPHLHGKAEAYRSEPFFLEIVPHGIDKATGLAALLSIAGLQRHELMAFGDGFNDITMLQFAGLGVAMGNAQDVVKRTADYITQSNEEDGIAEAVERFILCSRQ